MQNKIIKKFKKYFNDKTNGKNIQCDLSYRYLIPNYISNCENVS